MADATVAQHDFDLQHRFDPPLVEGRLVRRYKRFLSDVELEGGEVVVAHCMNTGSMKGLVEPGSRVWIRDTASPKRKLAWTWEIASEGETLVGINTSLPNELVAHAAETGRVEALAGYTSVRREVRYGSRKSRIDVLLEGREGDPRPCYVEVKNVTLSDTHAGGDGSVALFPDAVTARGLKHLLELRDMVADEGARAVLAFVVQRGDAEAFGAAGTIDPEYARTLTEVAAAGVEVLPLQAAVTPEGVGIARVLPWPEAP